MPLKIIFTVSHCQSNTYIHHLNMYMCDQEHMWLTGSLNGLKQVLYGITNDVHACSYITGDAHVVTCTCIRSETINALLLYAHLQVVYPTCRIHDCTLHNVQTVQCTLDYPNPFGLEVVNSLDNWNCPKCKYQQHHYTLSVLLTLALAWILLVWRKQLTYIVHVVEIQITLQDGHCLVNYTKVH